MIIAIVLVVAGGIFLFVSMKKGEVLEKQLPKVQQIPGELAPVREYVQGCLMQTAKDAFNLLGTQSGYIGMEQMKINNLNPTESDALELMPNTGIMVPYWWHLSSSNKCTDCSFSSKKPSLATIEEEAGGYIEANIDGCLDLSQFKEFEISPVGEPEAEVSITKTNIVILLEYPLHVRGQSVDADIPDYRTELDLNFRKIYALATEMLNNEINNTFFERNTLNWITMASMPGPDESRIPPMTGSDFDCGLGKIWVKTDVKRKLTQVISAYVPLLQVYGASNYARVESDNPISQAVFDGMIMPLGQTEAQGLDVSMIYLNWPVYFRILPSNGELIQADSISLKLLYFNLLCMHTYDFSYDLSYPIVITIEDRSAYKGEGYSFSFAVESNIRVNEPMNTSSLYKLGVVEVPFQSQFCNPEQRLSGEVIFNITDHLTGEQLEDVNIDFCIPDANGQCDLDICSIGSTDSSGLLKEKLPLGAGLLLFSHPLYFQEYRVHYSQYKKEDEIALSMNRIVEKRILLKKKLIKKVPLQYGAYTWKYIQEEEALQPSEQAIIALERISENEDPYTAFASFHGDEDATLNLLPGKYAVDITVINYDGVTIPKDRVCYQACPIFCDEKCEDIPEVRMDAVPLGNTVINTNNSLWELKEEDIYSDKAIVFYAIAPDISAINKHNDLEQLSSAEILSMTYRDSIEPNLG
ncbi:hypothetical protein JXA85_04845 [Candidatus Woesearchaeota archaeon]|nr:hypothetical protein [Candidatus Woesearchaeota archaeon]